MSIALVGRVKTLEEAVMQLREEVARLRAEATDKESLPVRKPGRPRKEDQHAKQ